MAVDDVPLAPYARADTPAARGGDLPVARAATPRPPVFAVPPGVTGRHTYG